MNGGEVGRRNLSPFRWLSSLAWKSFWALPVLLLIAAILLAGLLLWADAEGLSVWLQAKGWPWSMSGGTAQELASVLVGVHAALVTLYFSITLLVLTLAASNLGVRLIDRWIAKNSIRWTIGLLLGGLGWSLITLWAVDPDASGSEVARGTLTALLGYTLFVIAWLAGALHDLGRTIHVDIDIADIGSEGKSAAGYFQNSEAAPCPDFGGSIVRAACDGYIEGIDFDELVKTAKEHDYRFRLDKGIGRYVLKSEPLGRFETDADADDCHAAAKLFSYGDFRANAQGVVFDVRLLVEIAARALSPAVNDFYTGLACCDRLGSILAGQAKRAKPPGWIEGRIYLADHSFDGLFDPPLASLRQAAASYPSVSLRMIEMFGRAAEADIAPSEQASLLRWARQFAEHAITKADLTEDKQALVGAFRRAFPAAAVDVDVPAA